MHGRDKSQQELLEELASLRRQVTALQIENLSLRQARQKISFENETKFQTLAETTTAAIFIYQGMQNCYVNQATEIITGYSRDELLTMNFWDVIHPDFRELIKQRGLDRQQGTAIPSHYEVKVMTKDGHHRWLDFTGAVIDFQGKPAVLGTAFDITERKRVEDELIQRNLELITLQYAGATIAASLDIQFVLDTFTRELTNLLRAKGCAISEWDWSSETLKIMAQFGLPIRLETELPARVHLPRDYAAANKVLVERRAQQLTLNRAETNLTELIHRQGFETGTVLMLPMECRDQVVGLVEVMTEQERIFSNEEIRIAQLLANQAACAIENAHLYDETHRRLQAQIALQKATIAISSTLDLSSVLCHIAEQLGQAVDATSAYLCSYEAEKMTSTVLTEYFSPNASAKERVSDLGVTYRLPRDFSTAFKRLQAGQPEVIHADDLSQQKKKLEHIQQYGAKTILNIPLQIGGRIIAFAELWESRRKREFNLGEVALCQGIAQQAAIALENARLYDQAQQEIAERRRVEKELRESEARIRALLDAIPDVMFRVTREGQYLDYHSGKEADLGLSPQQYLGKNLNDVLPPEIAKLTMDFIHKVLNSGAIQVFEYRMPLLLSFQDFEIRLVASGSNEVLILVRDITERKRMEEQAIQAERLAALGRLSAALTHEINNPLQAIQTHLDLMLDFSLEPGEEKKFLQIMRQEIARLYEITRRILNFARPHPASRQRVLITEIIEEVLMLAGKQLQRNRIEVINDWRDVPLVLGSPDQLIQVFLNLVINAIEIVPPDGRLHIAIYPEGDRQVAISFTNNGPTIPPEVLPHIFEPFYTTKSEGSGLGLWVSHSLIQQHGGSLVVENLGSDQGVVFTINLPAAPSLRSANDGSNSN